MKHSGLSALGIVLAAFLFLFVNSAASVGLRGARLDLTDNGLYTLSQGSRNIASCFDEPVTLRLYASAGLASEAPALKSYAERVRELLAEYEAASDGGIVLRTIDPEPFSEQEDEAVAAGLQGVPVNAVGDLFYLGLVGTNATDDRRVVPFFHPDREEHLEYEISRLLYELSDPDRPVVGLLSTLPLQGAPSASPFGAPGGTEPWFVLDQIRQLFEVRVLDLAVEDIDTDIDVLMVVHPKDLGTPTLEAIDRYAVGGGRLLVFVDPHSEEDLPASDPGHPMAGFGAPRGSDLPDLFAAWGLRLRPGVLAADAASALRVTGGSSARPEVLDYVTWLGLGGELIDGDDLVTAGLDSVLVPTAGVLEPLPDATTSFEPLLTTSAEAMEVPVSRVQFLPDPKSLLSDYVPGAEPLVVAARVSGPIRSADLSGAPAPAGDGDEGPDAADAAEADAEDQDADDVAAPAEGRLDAIVVADVDLLADRWWVQFQQLFGMKLAVPTSDNADFVINALDNLAGSSDLISIRGRGSFRRPFELLEDIRRDAERRFLAEEQELQQRLRDTERRITELQRSRDDGSTAMLSPEQQELIEQFREERIRTRKDLRDVQHQLQTDIESAQLVIKAVNIVGAPLLIVLSLAGLARAWRRRHTWEAIS